MKVKYRNRGQPKEPTMNDLPRERMYGSVRVCVGDPNVYRPARLAPPESFSDEVQQRNDVERRSWPETRPIIGRHSQTVRAVLASRCCGWTKPPTSEDFYDAIRAENPTEDQRGILMTWLREAADRDWFHAWLEGAYSWRMLARAAHASGLKYNERWRWLNEFVENRDDVADEDREL